MYPGNQRQRTIPIPRPLKGEIKVTDIFDIGEEVGKGTYGVVNMAVRKSNKSQILSVKQTRVDKEAHVIPISSMRELILMTEINYPHIVHISEKDIFYDQDSYQDHKTLSFAYDFGTCDVRKIIHYYRKKNVHISPIIVKSILFQILLALDHIHQRNIAHCDLTPPNLLIMPKDSTTPGILKLLDFGLAHVCDRSDQIKSYGVVTIWYRAPELLIGDHFYDQAVDIWSAGCIFAELLTNNVLFSSKGQTKDEKPTEFNPTQLSQILSILGLIPDEDMILFKEKACEFYQNARELNKKTVVRKSLDQFIGNCDPNAFQLLKMMLDYNPKNRISAAQALRHPYFNEAPIPMMNIAALFPSDEWNEITALGAKIE